MPSNTLKKSIPIGSNFKNQSKHTHRDYGFCMTVLHPLNALPQNSGVRSQTSYSNTNMVINANQLLLVAAKFLCVSLHFES